MRADIRFASEIIWSNHVHRDTALTSDPSTAVKHLYDLQDPPNGQHFDNIAAGIVDAARKRDCRDVIDYLRSKTGQDLGDKPGAWIKQFGDGNLKHMQDIMYSER
jgi:hypothetical protein